MTENRDGVSRRHALRLVLGRGAEIARERDRDALALDQEAALEGAAGSSDPSSDEDGSAPPSSISRGKSKEV